jgi:hypothetical protein
MSEQRVPEEFQVAAVALRRAPVPASFRAEPIRTIAMGILPALALADPWEQSRVQPLPGRVVPPDTAEERRKWEAERLGRPEASAAEMQALLRGALSFTMDKVRQWW